MKDTPHLTLQIMESKEIIDTRKIEISVRGYSQSKRSTADGLVIFGTNKWEAQIPNDLINVECVDFLIENDEFGLGPKHFAIYYDTDSNDFKLVDLF